MMLHLEKSKGEEAEAEENKPLLTEWKTKWKKKTPNCLENLGVTQSPFGTALKKKKKKRVEKQ